MNKGNNGSLRAMGAVGASTGVSAALNEQKELNLIEASRAGASTDADLDALDGMVRGELSNLKSNIQPTRPELMSPVSSASAQNLICSKWSGAMDFKGIAHAVATQMVKAVRRKLSRPSLLRARRRHRPESLSSHLVPLPSLQVLPQSHRNASFFCVSYSISLQIEYEKNH
jgi:hypothetical protein